MWVLESSIGLRDTEDEEDFFQEGQQHPGFKLKPYQQAQARLSTGASGLGLPAAVMRRFSASLGNLVGTLPTVTAALTGPLGESVKNKMSGTVLVKRMEKVIQELHQEDGVSQEGLQKVLPPSWVRWALNSQGENGRRHAVGELLAAHDGESITPRKAQHKYTKSF